MPPIQRTLTDIPDSDVDEVMNDFKSEGCKVEKQRQSDGKWTVTASCPNGD